jgi:hypoxanthine-DNA glycosylase
LTQVRSFPPIIDKKSRVLILGSMPGEESLRKQQYYAHPRNQFWRIIYALFGQTVEEDYQKRTAFLKSRGIGLWDVIESCYREGSLDSDIRRERPNDFDWLFIEYPNIAHVFFNGAKAYDTFRKKVGFGKCLTYHRLESTSPANTKTFEYKLKNWSVILQYLERTT